MQPGLSPTPPPPFAVSPARSLTPVPGRAQGVHHAFDLAAYVAAGVVKYPAPVCEAQGAAGPLPPGPGRERAGSGPDRLSWWERIFALLSAIQARRLA